MKQKQPPDRIPSSPTIAAALIFDPTKCSFTPCPLPRLSLDHPRSLSLCLSPDLNRTQHTHLIASFQWTRCRARIYEFVLGAGPLCLRLCSWVRVYSACVPREPQRPGSATSRDLRGRELVLPKRRHFLPSTRFAPSVDGTFAVVWLSHQTRLEYAAWPHRSRRHRAMVRLRIGRQLSTTCGAGTTTGVCGCGRGCGCAASV